MNNRDSTNRRAQWWVFDRPLARDPLFASGFALGLVGIVAALLDGPPPFALGFSVVSAIPMGLLFVGAIGGSIREFRRARRSRVP